MAQGLSGCPSQQAWHCTPLYFSVHCSGGDWLGLPRQEGALLLAVPRLGLGLDGPGCAVLVAAVAAVASRCRLPPRLPLGLPLLHDLSQCLHLMPRHLQLLLLGGPGPHLAPRTVCNSSVQSNA